MVLTEYWKVVDSQSGRQSHWVAETFLIALKNLGVSSRLRGNLMDIIDQRTLLRIYHPVHLQVLVQWPGFCGKYLNNLPFKKNLVILSIETA